MRKVLILGPDLRLPGGVAAIYNTLQLEQEEGVDYFVVNAFEKQSAIKKIFRLLSNYWKFIAKVRKGKYELVHINPSLQKKSFYRDGAFIMLAKMLNKKVLVFFHGWQDTYEEKIRQSKGLSFWFRRSYAKADQFVVLSKMFQEKLIRLGVPATAKFNIGTTVADSAYVGELDLEKKFAAYGKEIQVLFLSRIEKTKGIYEAIDAFEIFQKNNPDRKAGFVIAGDGSELAPAKEYAAKRNSSAIRFLGNVSGEPKKLVLLESHIMLFPSHTEGLPNCILEAMLYGMPVISRVTGGIPDVISQDVNGYLSESFDPGIFAGFLSRLSLDAELYKRVALNNHKQAMENYTTEKVRQRMLDIYQQFN